MKFNPGDRVIIVSIENTDVHAKALNQIGTVTIPSSSIRGADCYVVLDKDSANNGERGWFVYDVQLEQQDGLDRILEKL